MRSYLGVLATLCATAAGAAAQQPQVKQLVQVPGTVAGLPFSPGALGNLPATRQLVDTGIVKQTQQTLENIQTILAAAGSSLDRVFKCTVFLTNIADYAKMNEVYATYFPKDPPARSTVAGSGLALGARVEIECMATVA